MLPWTEMEWIGLEHGVQAWRCGTLLGHIRVRRVPHIARVRLVRPYLGDTRVGLRQVMRREGAQWSPGH